MFVYHINIIVKRCYNIIFTQISNKLFQHNDMPECIKSCLYNVP